MALENDTGFVMPVAPSGNGYGGFGMGNDALWILFLFAMMCGGFGNGFGGNGNGAYPWMLASNTDNGVRAGFNQAATDSALNGIQQSITAGFSGVEVASCNRTIAELERSFNAQTAKLIANNEAQTTALEQYLAPVPRPAWIVPQNTNCFSANTGCGCGSF